MPQVTDVAIIGAGPYGLSLASYLRARGVAYRIFGESMRFWRDMPVGINLKSLAFATNIAVPERGYSFPEWCRQHGLEDYEPCTMQSFATYGLEMQQRFVPDLEDVLVANVAANDRGFDLTLQNGDFLRARRVVVATGLSGLARIPQVLQELPPELMRHTSAISDYSVFQGKSVAVVGAGASAIEAGALVHEAGGSSEIFVRGPAAYFHDRTPRHRPLWRKIKDPISVLGASRKSWVLQQVPLVVYFMPKEKRVPFVKGYLGPASPWWIRDRVLGKVPIHVRHEVVKATQTNKGVRLGIHDDNNSVRDEEFDYVITGTGFDSDVTRLSFLDPCLKEHIRCTERVPDLNMRFESSVPGLHFIGPLSYMSFGPLFRFVTGAEFTARTLSRWLAH
jgi:cation diffusion facilitator CzcD-associated flavoprotein CzcO